MISINLAYVYALSTSEAISDVETKFDNIETYKAVYRFKVEDNEQSYTTEGEIFFKKPDKVKMEMLLVLKEPMKQTVISNGRTMWIYILKFNQASRIDIDNLKAFFGADYFNYQEPNLCKPFKEMNRKTLRFLGIEKLNGEDMYVFEGEPSPLQIAQGNMPSGSKVKLWVGVKDGLQYKTSIFDESGKEVIEHTFKDFVINQLINDYEFEFRPPSDAQVIDSTEEIKVKMKDILRKL